MEPLGSFSQVLNVLPKEKIEGPPRDCLKANLRPHPRPDQRPKTRGAAGPKVFGPLVWPRMWPRGCLENFEGGLQYSSDGVHCVLKGPPEGSIHHDTSEAFPQILFLFTLRTLVLREA